jgi:hypothetical protein
MNVAQISGQIGVHDQNNSPSRDFSGRLNGGAFASSSAKMQQCYSRIVLCGFFERHASLICATIITDYQFIILSLHKIAKKSHILAYYFGFIIDGQYQ